MGYNNDFVTVPKASENAYGDQTGDSNNSSQNTSSKSDNSSRKSKGDRDIKARRAKKNNDEDDKNQNKLMQEAGKKAGKKGVTNLLKGALKQGFLATLRNMVNYIWNLAKAAVGFIAKLPFVLAVGVVGLAITAIVAITTAVATTTTQEVVSTLDSVPEKPTAYVRSAATGNSDYEIEFATKTLSAAQREMARRIWTTFGGFKVKEITNFLPGVNPLDPDAPIPDTPLVGDTAMAQIWNFFAGKNLSANAIAGLMGNLQAESGFNPKAFNPGGGGHGAYGIAQWRGGRQEALRKYATEHGGQPSSLEMQLGYLWQELTSPSYRSVYNTLTTPDVDVRTVSTAVLQGFEKPGDSKKQSTINYRAGLGNKIYAQLNGKLPGGVEPDVPTSPVTPIERKTFTAKISYGLRPEQICGLLGNWATDSQLDPTAVDTVNNEPFRIGPVKQRAQVSDFVSKFGWSENQGALSTYKAGIGLGKWQDLGDINTTNLDLHNPGRNTKLMTYAKLYGRKYYLNVDGSSNGWNSEKWVDGDTNTEGLWYDPKIQLAFALDKSEVGDKVGEDKYAEWLWDWSEIGSDLFAGDKMPNIVGNDAIYGLRGDDDGFISGWHAEWRGGKDKSYYVVPGYNAPDPPPNGAKWESEECGWGRDPKQDGKGYFVVENEVNLSGTLDGGGKVNAIGDETADRFHYEDVDVRIKTFKGASVEPYYSTRSQYGRNDWKYEKWDVKDAVSTKNINWEKEPIHDKIIDLNDYGIEHAARKLAFEYAYKSADACWYGRLNDKDDPGVMFPNEAGVNEVSKYAYKNPDTPAIKDPSEFATKSYNSNFLIDNDIRKSDTEDGPYSLRDGHGYQHWGVVYILPSGEPQYGWIKDADPAKAANEAAFMQYQQCFKIVYRYHLYRIMTDYYTAQFLRQYENIDDAVTLEKRQKIARQYFQMWWDSGQCEDIEGKSEPNKYAELDKRPVVAQDPDLDENYLGLNESEFDDNFFKIEQGYAQGIMQGIERTQDKLEEHETDHKVYKSDYNMANGEHIANTTNVAIAKAAALIAWPTLAQSYGNDGIDCYKEIHDKVFSLFGGGDDIYQSCDRTVATAIRWSGCDDNFPGGNTLVQMEYLNSSPRWTEIDWGGDINCLRPGDVLIRKDSLMMGADGEKPEDTHHVLIYVGNYWCKACYKTWGKAPIGSKCLKNITIVEGSYGEHSPAMTSLGENEVRSFHAYRCTDPMASNKSKYNSITFTDGNVTTWPDDPDTPEDPVDPPDPDNYEDDPVDGREDGIIGIEDTDDSFDDDVTIDDIINAPDSPNPDPVPQDIEKFLRLLDSENLNISADMKARLQNMLRNFMGVPYSKEGEATRNATDCSGLIWQVFRDMLPGRYSADTYGKSYTYGVSDPKPGDLIFFKGTSSQRSASQYSHVGVYLGNGRFFHASSSGCHVTDIRKSSYWQKHQPEIRRIRPRP